MSELVFDGSVLLKNPELVLFDKDGTLVDLHHYWVSMIRIRSEKIIERWFSEHKDQRELEFFFMDAMGVELATGRMKPDGPVGVKPRPYIVKLVTSAICMYGCDTTDDQVEALFFEVDQWTSEQILPLLKLLPGVLVFLERLQECGIATAVVSSDITSRVRLAMQMLDLDRFFLDIVGGDAVINNKPAPDMVLDMIKKHRCSPDKVVVIGDHPVDIRMGEAAGAGVNIGVLTGLSGREAFKGLNCTVIPDLNSIGVES